MKEKLIIKNFGPIKSVELDLGRFNILIGEQATGKSTVAKVLAVCRYFSFIIGENDDIFDQPFSDGLEAWGLKESVQKDSYIYYKCRHYEFIAETSFIKEDDVDDNGELYDYPVQLFSHTLTPLSDEFRNLLAELEKIKPRIRRDTSGIVAHNSYSSSIPTSFFQIDVVDVLDNPFYLPTQRGLQSIFSIGKSSINNISDSLFNQLAKMDGIARHFTNETYIEPLDIYYKNVRGHGYIRKASETKYYSLFNAASGYQSEIPIVLVIKYYTELKKRSKTFLIEESEQNLFPSAQDKLMHYLVDKTVNYGNSMLLTTQSPYVLTSVNNMMYAYQAGQMHAESVSNILDKKYWLNPDEVSAYRLLKDGTIINIVDKELKQINLGEIDEISGEINDDWDKLADIEFGKS